MPASHFSSPPDKSDREHLTPRELKASIAAGRQGLNIRRSSVRPGSKGTFRYDLVSERDNQPVATDLELKAIEVWLCIRGQPGRSVKRRQN
jgi:hypothetical protein